MARISTEEGFDILKGKVIKTVDGLFPIVGKKHSLELKSIQIKDNLNSDDLRSQKKAKINGRTWAVPVEATVLLKDVTTGKAVDEQTMRLFNLPKTTSRHSQIVDGQEYQVDNQWRLKSGIYARVKDNGELESAFNLAKGRGFSVGFDPKERNFNVKYGTSHIPLQPLLREMGVPQAEIEQKWGKQITEANAQDSEKAVMKFFKASTGGKAENVEQAREHLKETFGATKMIPDVNKITLGKAHDKVTGSALMDASTKLLHVSQGKAKPDARDALMFKELHSTEDFISERIEKGTYDIMRRVNNTLDKKKKVRDIIGPDVFGRPVKDMYTKNTLSNVPEQTNPLEMFSGQMKTTITGEGGIKSAHGISEDAKLIDPSHLGFLDPIHTPEGSSTGVALRLPIGVKKNGHDVGVTMFNVKTGKNETINPEKVMNSNVVLPDQVRWVDGKPVPVGKSIKMSTVGNDIMTGSMKDAQYVMRDPIQMFSMGSNLIPFLASDHPLRSTMAGRHMEQAISLKDREAPLVQSLAGTKTFEGMMGQYAGHVAPTAGKVTKITNDAIHVKDAAGKTHERQIYDHFPLNADKSFMHSTPTVKVGDSVKKGQSLADSNFTQKGTLALGTNLKVGYMPYKGYNFEDGVVISESAAKKLSSEHLHRKTLTTDKSHILSKKKFQSYVPEAMTREQADKLDDDGVMKQGQIVMPGDTLVAALQEKTDRTEDKELAKIHKSLVKPYQDASVKWEADHPGTVTEVIKRGKQTAVHVKTLEPMEIGDKLAGRHGNKGIVTKIIPDDEMPRTKDGALQVLLNPTGIPGRANLGQVMETAAGKIAEKTGKPYIIKNFEPDTDLHAKLTKDLKTHGLSDKEDVFDPNGKKLGSVLVGPQHIIKLKHQVEKKLVARAGGAGYAYDRNMIPKSGGPHGAQALGSLGLYSMLAHGAKHNLREMQTYKSDAAQGDEFWSALQAGEPLPAPRPTFAYKKFTSYLNALGVNVKKEGNNLSLIPFTDKNVEEMSNGVVKDAGRMVRAKDLKPEANGLFDPKVTGGIEGTKWSHMKLPEPFPNPLFEKAIKSLSGLKTKDFSALVGGTKALDPKTGKLTDDLDEGITGGKAIGHMLKKIDVTKELETAKTQLANPNLKANRLDQANKKVKYLTALQKAGLSANDAYMMKNVPILPPSMRPISQFPNGDLNVDDLNHMYKGISLSARQLKGMSPLVPEESKAEVRAEIYDGLKSLTGIGGTANREFRGIIDVLSGKRPNRDTGGKVGSPKDGYFQSKLVQRKQDLSMRSTIIPEPSLGLDEVALPRAAAMEIYKPFIVKELRGLTGASPLKAQQMIKDGEPIVGKALERIVENRPVLLKRDPALHKYNIQGFKPRITGGKAVKIHPLVTSGFTADFDGNCVDGCSKVVIRCTETTKGVAMKFSPLSEVVVHDEETDVRADRIEIRRFPREEKPHKYDRNGAAVYRVPDGLQVLSYDHFLGEPTFEDVTELTIEEDCPVVEVTYASGHSVVASTNESLCIYDHETGRLRKACPEESIGALSPTVSALPGNKYDKDFGWMLGAFISDGFFTNGRIGITKLNDQFRARFGALLRKFGTVHASHTYRREEASVGDLSEDSVKDHYTVDSEMLSVFRDCYTPEYQEYLRSGIRSEALKHKRAALFKRLPVDIGDYSRDALIGVLSGMLDGDGTLSWSNAKNNKQLLAGYSTSSPQLKDDVRYLCHLLGIRCSASPVYPKEGRVQKHVNYVVSFSIVDIESLVDELSLVSYADTLRELKRYPTSKDDRDVVPVPLAVGRKLSSKKSKAFAADPKLCRSLATLISKHKRYPRVSRAVAYRMLPWLDMDDELEAFWSSLVRSDVRWSYVQSVEDRGKTTVYDLVIPTTKIFAVNDGLVVWDTMAAFVPVSTEAVDEAKKMYPSRNLFNPATGDLMYKPTLESQLGLYGISKIGDKTSKSFSNIKAVESAHRKGEIGLNDQIKVNGVKSTTGRFMVAGALPADMRRSILSSKTPLDKKGQANLLTQVAKDHRNDYGEVVNKLKDLGNKWSTETAFSIGLDDIKPEKATRQAILTKADKAVSASGTRGEQRDTKSIREYDKATQEMHKKLSKLPEKNNALMIMHNSGIKPTMETLRQIKMAPMLFANAKGETIPTPARKSFAEGLDLSDYWTSMSGARKGIIQKVQSVQEPGYISKQVMNSVMNNSVLDDDCGAESGINLSVDEKDILDRYLASDVKAGKSTFKRGTLVTPEIRNSLRNNKIRKVPVRTPLRCQHGPGLCKKCYGLDEDGKEPAVGLNVGVLAGQALGERATQLSMKAFHSGGTAASKEGLVDDFQRVKDLLLFPKILPGSATLSTVNGNVSRVQKDPAGGHNVFVRSGQEEVRHYVPQSRGAPAANGKLLRKGARIKKGMAISNGPVNPHEMLPLAGVEPVQGYLSKELHGIYGGHGIRRRNTEVVVKSLTNLTKIEDPGDRGSFIRGDFAPTSLVANMNRQVKGGKPILHNPVLKGVNVLPLDMQEDWMARMNHQSIKSTVTEAAQQGWTTKIQGKHPIPPVVLGTGLGRNKPGEY